MPHRRTVLRGLEVEPSVEDRRLKVTGKRRVERMQRASQMLSMRLQGASLAQIADAQDPPISFQAVHKVGVELPKSPIQIVNGRFVLDQQLHQWR